MKEKIKNSYIIFFCIYIIMAFVDKTTLIVDYKPIYYIAKAIRYLTYLYFCIRLIIVLPEYKKDLELTNFKNKSKFEKFTIGLVGVLAICCIINFIKTQHNTFVIVFLVLLSSYKVDYKKITKCILIVMISLTSLIVLLSIFGITQNVVILRDNAEKLRYSLGFSYANGLPKMILFSILIYGYTRKFRLNYFELFEFQLLNGLSYFLTDSRTEFIILEIVIIIVFLYKLKIIDKLKNICVKIASLFVHTFFLYPILNIVLVFLYPKGGIFDKINSLLSDRLLQVYNNIMEYGLTWFGDNIEYVGNGIGLDGTIASSDIVRNYVDSGYFRIMFDQGVIFAVAFIILLNILIYILYKKKKYNELFICSICLIRELINSTVTDLVTCPVLFFVIPIFIDFFKEKRKTSKIDEEFNDEKVRQMQS